jgi:tRNA 2-thiouridine synthesizing protein D
MVTILGKIAFVLMTTPYSFQNSDTVIKLANAALKAGHTITGIYLYTDGVYNVVKDIQPSDDRDRNIAFLFQELAEKGIPIVSCPLCAQYRGIYEQKKIIDKSTFDGLGALSEFVEEADRILIFTS